MREKLNNEELIALYEAVTGGINAQFELWLTITFAVIIASHLAGHRLSRSFKYLIASLYSAVSVLLFLMLLGALQFSAQFDAIALGTSNSGNLVGVISVLRTAVWIFGSVATLIFIFRGHINDSDSDA